MAVADLSRLVLGTAQFGMDYGVTNLRGEVPRDEVASILRLATVVGIHTLDTACDYGRSETVLGAIGVGDWDVITKLPAVLPTRRDVVGWVEKHVVSSLERLGISQLSGLLVHRANHLLGRDGEVLYAALRSLSDQGLVSRIGISIYEPHRLASLIADRRIDIVQTPYNLFDRRIDRSGWLDSLTQRGSEVHLRSIFLQGLLLSPPEARPAYFRHWEPLWNEYDKWLREGGMTPMEACLGFALQTSTASKIVVGVESEAQLRQLLDSTLNLPAIRPTFPDVSDPMLIDPSKWELS